MKNLKVKLTFTEEILGTASANPEIHAEFIASKSPDAKTIEEEVAAIGVEEATEKAMTIFPKMKDGTPFIYDYQIRGFFKEVCGALKKVPKTKSSTIKAYKKEVDSLIFVEPRHIPIVVDKIGNCQRPLRGQTAQGERISLANSETIPAGASIEFTVQCLVDSDTEAVREWLKYGRLKGLGQWRNSGKGKFKIDYIEETAEEYADFIDE